MQDQSGKRGPHLTLLRPKGPRGCPACETPNHNGQCELRTLTASQIGAFLALLIGLGLYFVEAWPELTGKDRDFFFEFIPIFTATFIYYSAAEWEIEETYFQYLRELSPPRWMPRWISLAYAEFWTRVGVIFVLAAALAFPTRWIHIWGFGDRVDWGLFCLMVIYGLFLIWDSLLVLGDKPEIALRFFRWDLVSGVLVFICVWGHIHEPPAAIIAAMLLFAITVFQVLSNKQMVSAIIRPFEDRHNVR